ncbi:tripartite tricarboxylate transporter substrate binding protein [Tardiphaga sp. vice352]|uniref:tripartite tricarboxylate transporter substrate binding protein n=1 Tax=unclassified Tardiphaga TaxID=2631404 RepID=UPI001162C967|nr:MULTISPECIES: tripartite tricarboxylate transporter substrate binding protein [unclassified Tardiphaga]QDM18637.1 tripartite tricarboxylate transporter substrate binding protein [Tardiphaga sp. vice278]QDM23633.1 tripartite tricarboxylate transporter substrate binding protein [Tardiphaga sp. vice154]QDM28858.1 tripartite tricarboxylate transporter substrate binding protein [Tardiphaga sp. vice304]QDM33957.1 tripartite tricarboxylate transporter substrate binding protein [Tardiphaga sp. vice3
MEKLAGLAFSCLLLACGGVAGARAQGVPAGQVRIIVPFPAGGTTDILARFVGQYLGDKLGVIAVIENRAGASGTIGSEAVAKSPADGSVLLLTATHHVINPSLRRNLPYDTQKDFSPIAVVATAPNALVVSKDFPARSVAELIAMAKREPGKLSFGSSGIGGANHLSGELFKQMADIKIEHIPYKGAAPAMNDLIGGHIPIMFDTLPTVLPAAEGGTIRVLAVTSLQRAAALPDVPTLDEAGVKGFEATAWFGLYMPRAEGNPAYLRLVRAMQEILVTPAIREKFATQGVEPGKLTGTEFAGFVDSEIKKWNAVARAANVPQE